MARRSRDEEVIRAIAALVLLGVGAWMFVPQFRAVMIVAGVVALLALAVWVGLKLNKSRLSQTFDRNVNWGELGAQLHTPTKPVILTDQLRKIDWFQFEKLIELIYRQRGYSVQRLGGANPDGGVDLIVESANEKFVIQCKHWKKWNVGVRQIREFLGTLADTKIQSGIFITLTGYSSEAKALADKHGIKILDESDVVKMLEESELRYSQGVSELLSDSRKFCPKCENELVLRKARLTGNQFWGCSTYPRCKFTMKCDGER